VRRERRRERRHDGVGTAREHGGERVHALHPAGHAVVIAVRAYAAVADLTRARCRERTGPSMERERRRVGGGEVEALSGAVLGSGARRSCGWARRTVWAEERGTRGRLDRVRVWVILQERQRRAGPVGGPGLALLEGL
jgi:hypothetical protein